MNNLTISASSIAIGAGARSEDGEISLARDGKQVTLCRGGVVVGDRLAADDEAIVRGLVGVFGAPGELQLVTPQFSLKIDVDGRVCVNGEEVGRDSQIYSRAACFFLRMFAESLLSLQLATIAGCATPRAS